MSDSFDRALRAAARRGRPAGVCPDASMLASYADNGLTGDERRVLEAHVADCAVCLEHLALLGAVSLDREPPQPSSSWLVRWGWLVPVATAVLVVAVWVRLPEQQQVFQPERVAPPSSTEPAAPVAQESSADTAATPIHAERDEADSRIAGKAKPSAAARAQAPEEAKLDELRTLERRDAARENAASAPARPFGDLAARPPAPATPPAIAAPSPAATAGVGAQKEETQVADSVRQRAAEPQLRKSLAEAEASFASASPSEVYRVAGNRIEQSRDGAQTWREVLSDPRSTFTAAACAPGGPCWFGTADGEVLRRTESGFTRTSLPVRTRVVAIAPSGPQAATVSLDAGQRFRTTDGGVTWTSVP